MSNPNSEMITLGMMLRKVPTIVRALPRLVRGIRVANITDPDQPCGLGWTFEQATQRNPEGAALLDRLQQGGVVRTEIGRPARGAVVRVGRVGGRPRLEPPGDGPALRVGEGLPDERNRSAGACLP